MFGAKKIASSRAHAICPARSNHKSEKGSESIIESRRSHPAPRDAADDPEMTPTHLPQA